MLYKVMFAATQLIKKKTIPRYVFLCKLMLKEKVLCGLILS